LNALSAEATRRDFVNINVTAPSAPPSYGPVFNHAEALILSCKQKLERSQKVSHWGGDAAAMSKPLLDFSSKEKADFEAMIRHGTSFLFSAEGASGGGCPMRVEKKGESPRPHFRCQSVGTVEFSMGSAAKSISAQPSTDIPLQCSE
jgi:hypothetical protein